MGGQPRSVDKGSIEMEIIIRAIHNHLNYRVDNDKVYFKLEDATRGTSYAAYLKPFQRCKDGRSAFFAITTQHAGDDKCNVEIMKQDALLHNQKWKGNRSLTLKITVTIIDIIL